MKRIRLFLIGFSLSVVLLVVGVASATATRFTRPLNTLERTTSSIPKILSALDMPIEPIPHPILSDVRIRRAIAYCTNKDALLASIYPALTPEERQALTADTFVPTTSWAYTPPATTYSYNPTIGQNLLTEAGWILLPGAEYRTKDGRELVLTLNTTTSPTRVTYLSVFEAQMKACGIRVIRNHQPASWFFGSNTGLSVRDFELAVFAWVAGDDPGGRTIYACDQIPLPANNWSGQNFMGWCNEAASNAIVQASNTELPQDQRKAFYATFINLFAEDIPSLPLFFYQGSTTWEHIDFNLQTFAQEFDVTTGGATFTATDYSGNQDTISAPSEAVTQTVTLRYYPLVASAHPKPASKIIKSFRLGAYVNGVPLNNFSFSQPITLTVSYTATDITDIDEPTLALYYWDSGSNVWLDASETCPEADQYKKLDPIQNLFEVRVCHLTEFGLIGGKNIYLPLIMR
ncbi:MAG: ABC transporter substrate-binding protein [Bacteroidota bacterium]